MEFRTLKAKEVECRINQIESNWCSLLLYKDARVDQDILDETVGVMNWKKDYQLIDGQLFCTISIWDEDKKQWIGKQDVGIESFSQEEKGRASDAQKRSAFCFGIGRELYTAPSIFIFPKKEMGKATRKTDENGEPIYEPEFFDKGNGKYTTKTRFHVDYIKCDDNKNITDLIIKDHKGNTRFAQVTKETEKEMLKLMQEVKKLIEKREKEDKTFNRENLYKYFGVEADNQLGYEDMKKIITMLGEKK